MNTISYDPPLHAQVGYDYIAAVRRLLTKYTYSELAERVGYRSVGAVSSVLDGRVPSHIHGEAIWALYKDTFGEKPSLTVCKKTQAI